MTSIWSAARLRSEAKTDANNAEGMAEGENRRKRRNTHSINQIRIFENDNHVLNLVWGVRPLLINEKRDTAEGMVALAISTLERRGLVGQGDTIVVVGNLADGDADDANFIKVHTLPARG
jgi:pyruvate kinase